MVRNLGESLPVKLRSLQIPCTNKRYWIDDEFLNDWQWHVRWYNTFSLMELLRFLITHLEASMIYYNSRSAIINQFASRIWTSNRLLTNVYCHIYLFLIWFWITYFFVNITVSTLRLGLTVGDYYGVKHRRLGFRLALLPSGFENRHLYTGQSYNICCL